MGSGAGLSIRRQAPPDPDVAVDGDASLVQLNQELLEAGLEAAVVDALRRLPGKDRREHRDALRSAGVDALEGRLAGAFAKAAEWVPAAGPIGPDARDVVDDAIATLRQVGTGHVDGQPSPAADVLDAVPPLLAIGDVTPKVSVRLGVGWTARPAEQREDVLEYLAHLGAADVDVAIVAGAAAASRIRADHTADLPAWCLTKLADRRTTSAPPNGEQEARERAAVAYESLSPHGQPTAVLRHLRRSVTHSLEYSRLASEMGRDDPPYEAVRRLEADHELVERTERADGASVVSMRPAGLAYLRLLDDQTASDGGLCRSSSPSAVSASGSESGVSHGGQNPPDMPCYPAAYDRPPGPEPADGDEDRQRPPSEAAAAAGGDRRDNYREGVVKPAYARRMDWIPAVEAVDQGAVALVDADLGDRLEDDRDGRRPLVSYDADRGTVYVGGEYHNPMQFAVTLAHGLLCEELLATDDWAGRLGEDLRGLDIHERAVLWSATCVGWLPASVEDGADYLGELRDARDELLELSGKTRDKGGDVDRGTVTRTALGLIGTIVDVLDLLDVDVVLEARVPEFSRHYGDSNKTRREDLVDHLGTLAAISSRAGAFSAFRQLFEARDDRRSDAFTPGVEGRKHAFTGSLRAGFVVVGDGVEDLADDLEDKLAHPRPVVDDAPPISIPIDVLTGTDRERFGATIRRMFREGRNLRPTPASTMVLRAFARSPWAAAEAIHWGLEREADRRDVDLWECRRALATLGEHRLLGGAAPSARAGVATLLEADRELSQAELASRAGISTQSWRTHRDGLIAADVVRKTEDGWRVALPFESERFDESLDVARPPPYLLADADDVELEPNPHVRKMTDVLWWLFERGAIAAERIHDSNDPIGRAFDLVDVGDSVLPRGAVDRATADAALEALGIPSGLVHSGCWWAEPPPRVATMGSSTTQTTLPI